MDSRSPQFLLPRLAELEPARQWVFSCSLTERHLALLMRYADAHGHADEWAASRRWLDDCWAAAAGESVSDLRRLHSFAGLWPWWHGPGPSAARKALRMLECTAIVGAHAYDGLAGASLGASESTMLTLAGAGVDHERFRDFLDHPVLVEERHRRLRDVQILEDAEDLAEAIDTLRGASAAIAADYAALAAAQDAALPPRLPAAYQPRSEPHSPAVVAALRGLDDEDWRGLGDAYGFATGIPTVLRNRASRQPDIARIANDELFGAVVHQWSVYEVTPIAVPYMLRLAACESVHERHNLLQLVAIAGVGNGPVELRDQVERAFEAAASTVAALLTNDDLDIAASALAIIASLPGLADHHATALTRLQARMWTLEHLAALDVALHPADANEGVSEETERLLHDLGYSPGNRTPNERNDRDTRVDAVIAVLYLTGPP